jgi:hypothetical protein
MLAIAGLVVLVSYRDVGYRELRITNATQDVLVLQVVTEDESFLGAWFNDSDVRVAPRSEITLKGARFEESADVVFFTEDGDSICTLDWSYARDHQPVVVDGIKEPIDPADRDPPIEDLC